VVGDGATLARNATLQIRAHRVDTGPTD
jgi:hypothetical protein